MNQHSRPANNSPVTLINVFEVPTEHVEVFIAGWRQRAALMSTKPGFVDTRLHRALSPQTRFQLVNVAHWESREAMEAATADPEFQQRISAAIADPECRSRRTRPYIRSLSNSLARRRASTTAPRLPGNPGRLAFPAERAGTRSRRPSRPAPFVEPWEQRITHCGGFNTTSARIASARQLRSTIIVRVGPARRPGLRRRPSLAGPAARWARISSSARGPAWLSPRRPLVGGWARSIG